MSNYRIITDTCCDLPAELLQQLQVQTVALSVNYDGSSFSEGSMPLKDIYAGLRAGKPASTSAANPQQWRAAIEPVLQQELDALVIAFSSGLSTTYQSAVIAAEELREEYPGRQIAVVDSLAASMGQGLLVYYAARQRLAGQTLEQVRSWLEENRLKLCHWFTVDDLMYLKRGGRISAATAVMGTMLQIKPVLHVDEAGHLVNVSKVRGRKAALAALARKPEGAVDGWDGTVFISHGDCEADAREAARLIREQWGAKEVVIGYIGSVIGSHSGPGTVAVFYLGHNR